VVGPLVMPPEYFQTVFADVLKSTDEIHADLRASFHRAILEDYLPWFERRVEALEAYFAADALAFRRAQMAAIPSNTETISTATTLRARRAARAEARSRLSLISAQHCALTDPEAAAITSTEMEKPVNDYICCVCGKPSVGGEPGLNPDWYCLDHMPPDLYEAISAGVDLEHDYTEEEDVAFQEEARRKLAKAPPQILQDTIDGKA
jgi:hypothetical protein